AEILILCHQGHIPIIIRTDHFGHALHLFSCLTCQHSTPTIGSEELATLGRESSDPYRRYRLVGFEVPGRYRQFLSLNLNNIINPKSQNFNPKSMKSCLTNKS